MRTIATTTTLGTAHYTHIEPLDVANVRLYMSVELEGYKDWYNDAELDLYSALMLTGTKTYTKESLEMYLRQHGILISVNSGHGTLTIAVTVRKEKLPRALRIIEEIIFHPKFSQSEFTVKQKTALEENREAHDDAKLISEIEFRKLLYPKHPLLRLSTLEEERRELSRTNIRSIYRLSSALIQNKWYVTVVGDVDVERSVRSFVEKRLGRGITNSRSFMARTFTTSQATYTTVPGKTNIEIRIGNILPITPLHPAYIPFTFGIAVLGKVGGFSGRLMSTVREKEGLTYGIYAMVSPWDKNSTAHWNITTFFTAKDLEQGLKSVKRELESIVKDGITDSELRTFKEIILNQFLIAHDSNASRGKLYHTAALTEETPAYLKEAMERVSKLSKEEVNVALNTYIDPQALIISGAGPVTKDGKGIGS